MTCVQAFREVGFATNSNNDMLCFHNTPSTSPFVKRRDTEGFDATCFGVPAIGLDALYVLTVVDRVFEVLGTPALYSRRAKQSVMSQAWNGVSDLPYSPHTQYVAAEKSLDS